MKILFIRHAEAKERLPWIQRGHPDNLRPLSQKGVIQFSSALEGLSRLVTRIDYLYTSDYLRSVQTADLMYKKYPKAYRHNFPALNPEGNSSLLYPLIQGHEENDIICLVGHQPILQEWTSLLLNETPDIKFHYKKGGCALIDLNNGQATLEWLIGPKHLNMHHLE
jgi:phosphohistidine phosphatase SixA